MTLPTLDQLLAPVPTEVLAEQSLAIANEIDLPVTAWQDVSVAREIIWINSQIAHDFSVVTQTGAVAGGFLTYASGQWLTLCAYETFDTIRNESASATGKIRLVNATGVPFGITPGSLRVLNETAQKTYTNQNSGTVPANGQLDTIGFIADEPGSDSNLTSTDVLSLVTNDPGITPVFLENLIGQNEEQDPELKIRSREANAKASPNGPRDAYSYYAKSTRRPDGSLVGVTRTNVVQGNGTTTVYLADPDGALSVDDRGYVFSFVNESVVPTGFTLLIPSPSCAELAIDLDFTLTPNPKSSATHADVETRIETAVANYLSTIPIGGDKASSFKGVYHSTLITIIRVAAGEDVLNVVINSPVDNVTLTNAQAPVLGDYDPHWTT